MRKERQKTYLNKKQIDFLQAKQKTKAFIAGRGGGKSFVCGVQNAIRAGGLKDHKGRWVFRPMAKAKWGLFGPTMIHLKNNVVPSMIRGIKSQGFTEYNANNPWGTFVKFKKPPEHFDEPYEKPEDYSTVITFANGYTIQLYSWFSADLIRGSNLDGADIDEAAMLDKDDHDKAIFPTIRGNQHIFRNHRLHQQMCYYTSMPWLSSGMWVLEYQDKMIKHPQHIYFTKATSWDNVAVLGRDTLERWERDMAPLEYKVEIMCEQVDRVANCYYDEFNEKKHTYITPFDAPFSDVDSNEPLYISFDFNAGFTCCVVAQLSGNEIRIVRELFVKGTKLVDRLIELIAQEFESHINRRIYIYGDKQGTHRQINVSYEAMTYYTQIQSRLRELGWESQLKQIGVNPLHIKRHDVINKALSETVDSCPRIRFNKRGCIHLAIGMVKTPIKLNYEKDKSSEQDDHVPPEQATHLTDAFDYLIYRLCEPYIKGKRKKFRRRG